MDFAQVTFRGLDPSEFVEARVREKLAWLQRFYDGIVGARIAIERRHNSHHKGGLFHVRIYLKVAGGEEVVVAREPHGEHSHEDVYVAIRDAFNAARRQLEEHNRKLRGQTKVHPAPPHGRVVHIAEDYGFIRTPDEREVYFHRNALAEGEFERLQIGDQVRFDIYEGEGREGPQASTVIPITPMPLPAPA